MCNRLQNDVPYFGGDEECCTASLAVVKGEHDDLGCQDRQTYELRERNDLPSTHRLITAASSVNPRGALEKR